MGKTTLFSIFLLVSLLAITFIMAQQIYPPTKSPLSSKTILNSGLVAYYTFDETSGTTVIDSIGNYNGINNGAVIDQEGKVNSSYSFFGKSGSGGTPISFSNNDFFKPLTNFAIQAWFKTNVSETDPAYNGYAGTLFASSSQGYYEYRGISLIVLRDGSVIFYSGNDSTPGVNQDIILSSHSIKYNDNQWHHAVVSVDNEGLATLYLDNIVQATEVISPTYPSGNKIYLGVMFDVLVTKTNYFEGQIDEVGLWNRSLTPNEVEQLYNLNQGNPSDSDRDGILDLNDLCPNSETSSVDNQGCSVAQFCDNFNPLDKKDSKLCTNADWKNNDGKNPKDCKVHNMNKIKTCIASIKAN
jgi:hypothetical protein